ncbi:hypothetical protein FO519_007132 [Halicephalobus sp. NKZ332]|nr:hypothetical protein FO519_007132 [Halicephalobus sp. NKZ332]
MVGSTGCAALQNGVSEPFSYLFNVSVVMISGLVIPLVVYLMFENYYHLKDEKRMNSHEVYRVHHDNFFCLIFQLCVPLVAFVLPYSIIQLLVAVGSEQVIMLSQCMIVLTSMHSTANTVIMLFCIPAYRKGAWELFSDPLGTFREIYRKAERKIKSIIEAYS